MILLEGGRRGVSVALHFGPHCGRIVGKPETGNGSQRTANCRSLVTSKGITSAQASQFMRQAHDCNKSRVNLSYQGTTLKNDETRMGVTLREDCPKNRWLLCGNNAN